MKLKIIFSALTASAMLIAGGILPSSTNFYCSSPVTAAASASDSDTSIILDRDSLTLDYTYDTYYDVTGSITGDTGSDYYVYGVDDKDIVRTDSPAIKDGKFTVRLTPHATGTTVLMLKIKDKNTGKIVASAALNVTIKKHDFSNTKLSLSKSTVNVEEGKTTTVTMNLQNWPSKNISRYFLYSIGDNNIVSFKCNWSDIKWNGNNASVPITLTGLKIGKTTVKLSVNSYCSKKVIKETTTEVNVTEKDIYTDMKFSVPNNPLLLKSGEVETINVKADNIPSKGDIKFFVSTAWGNKDAAWTKWGKVIKSGTSMSCDLMITGINEGRREITVGAKDASTGRILRSTNITIDTLINFYAYTLNNGDIKTEYYNKYDKDFSAAFDLKNGNTFELDLCSYYYNDYSQEITSEPPTGIALKNVDKKLYSKNNRTYQLYNCTFSVSEAGTYKIPIYLNACIDDTPIEPAMIRYDVIVTDSRKTPVSTTAAADSANNTTPAKTSSAQSTVTSKVSSGELLGETSFDEKVQPWETYEQAPAKQTYSVENGALHITILSAKGKEGERWDLQLHHRDLDFKSGHSYKVSFKAKAKRTGMELFAKISNIMGDEEYFSTHGSKLDMGPAMDGEWGSVLKLDSSYKTYSGVFTPTKDINDAEWTFHYAYGNNYGGNATDGDEIWLDEISIYDTTIDEKNAVTTKATSTTTAKAITTTNTTTTTVITTSQQAATHETAEGYCGECGENAKWTLDEKTGELVIYGEGEIWDCEDRNYEWDNISDKIKSLKIENGITSVGSRAFAYMLCIKKIELPSTLTNIKDHAFCAVGAKDIILPDSVTNVEENAFAMSSVKYARLSSSMTEVPKDMFNDCKGLESIEISDNIAKIGKGAFSCCEGLKKVELPESVTMIESDAFSYCSNLESITIENPDCIIEEDEYEYSNTLGYDKTIIYGYVDSTAYKYAEGHYNKFISLEDGSEYEFGHVKGDANGDGKVNVRDAAFIAAKLAQGRSGELPLSADFNGDEKINVRDAAAIAKFLATGK